MSVLAYPPHSDGYIKCGYITSTEDFQFFSLGCLFCPETFVYFDAYIGHMQKNHINVACQSGAGYNGAANNWTAGDGQMCYDNNMGANSNMINGYGSGTNDADDLNETDAALLVPQIMVKQELAEEESPVLQNVYPTSSNITQDMRNSNDVNTSKMEADDYNYVANESGYQNDDKYSGNGFIEDDVKEYDGDDYDDEDDVGNYDDLVEQSLLQGNNESSGLAMHIKDRKMIQFVIDQYRRHPNLWDHRNPSFRDRTKRSQFLDWMLAEFKRRFNVSLARDAITRKWDNLRTVYKRECNRMSMERTNVSTLWYFKELYFLNGLYGGANKMPEAVVQETVHRRRHSALWNDPTTSRLLSLVHNYPCFYDRNHPDYRSKEKRGEALQIMAIELQKLMDVTTIQISKRISQLRFDYSKHKQERLLCEKNGKQFVPSYSFYQQMLFMDADIAPFKCEFCGIILHTSRDEETHMTMIHPSIKQNSFVCKECEAVFPDAEQYKSHKQIAHSTVALPTTPPATANEPKFFCDLCTASFREKSNYDEHIRRHNDELLLPGLADVPFVSSETEATVERTSSTANSDSNSTTSIERSFVCDICGKSFSSASLLAAHAEQHVGSGGSGERCFRCDYPTCGRSYVLHQSYLEHMRMHYSNEGVSCDVCGKTFKSAKNLQNHRQIHDTVKRYICKICGSAFAQAAGLYLHKRRHTRNPDGNVDRHRGRQNFQN